MPKIWEKFFARPCRPDDLDRARARWLVLGAGTLLAKLDGKALPIEADQERLWTLLSVAYGHGVPLAVLGSLRRVAKHWQGGDKRLAAIHLAQMGLPDIGEDAAFVCRWWRSCSTQASRPATLRGSWDSSSRRCRQI